MKRVPAAVLFDLDGTLLDSAPLFTDILNKLLQQAALPPLTVARLRPVIGEGAEAMVRMAFADASPAPNIAALQQAFLQAYTDFIPTAGFHYFGGVTEVVNFLIEQRIPFGVVTNKHQRFAEALLAQSFFKDDLGCAIYGDTLATPKPSPEPIYLACQQLQVVPADTWFIGDGWADMQAAQQAGSVGVLAAYGYVKPNWRSWPATYVIQQLNDVLVLFQGQR